MKIADRADWVLCGFFCVVANLLLLVAPVFMLQIYDRIMVSGSSDTLIWLSVLAMGLLGVYGAAEAGRRRVLALVGNRWGERASDRVFAAYVEQSNYDLPRLLGLVNRVRRFVQSGLPLALLDVPFAPLFVALLWVVHPWLGVLGLAGALAIVALVILAEYHNRAHNEEALSAERAEEEFVAQMAAQRPALISMGMVQAVAATLRVSGKEARAAAEQAASIDGLYAGASRALRQCLQIGALALGAALAILGEISAGAIVAGSILLSRALAPIDQLVGGWRSLVRTRAAFGELQQKSVFQKTRDSQARTKLPKPSGVLAVERLVIRHPQTDVELLRENSWQVKPAEVVVVLGANGCGKSSLLRVLAAVDAPCSGQVSLAGQDLHTWDVHDRGKHIGYLSQQIELLPGTVLENIARLQPDVDRDGVIALSQAHGSHEAILALPKGYDELISPKLSLGQAQRIGLLRAFYGDPSLILLDEPTANLDAAATLKFLQGVERQAQMGCRFIMATHDPRVINVAHTVCYFADRKFHRMSRQDYQQAQQDRLRRQRDRQAPVENQQ